MHLHQAFAPGMRKWLLLVSVFVLWAVFTVQGDEPEVKTHAISARFRVTTDVVNADLEPFAVTIGGFGNNLIAQGAGFEPVIYRNMYIAQEDSADRVVVQPEILSHWDTLREGFLDGAQVRVYRIEDGKLRMVRKDHIPEGGFHVSGWISVMKGNRMLPSDTSRFMFRWAPWNNPDAKYYFTVRAVDANGGLSAPAAVVEVDRPKGVGTDEVFNPTISFDHSSLHAKEGIVPVPRRLRGRVLENGSLLLEWEPAASADVIGYIVYRSDYLPQRHQGYFFGLAKVPDDPDQYIKAGDLVIVSKKFYSASRNKYHANRVWGADQETRLLRPGLVQFFPDEDPNKTWRLARHEADTPVEEPGETYLELRLNGPGETRLEIYNHSGTDQSWYDVLQPVPYRVEAWLRSDSPSLVQFKLTGFYARAGQRVPPITFQVGREWKKHVAVFTPPVIQDGERPNEMAMVFSGPGVFSVDNFRVYRADAAYLGFLPEDLEALRSSNMSALRTHGLIKTGASTYDAEQLTNPGGVINGTQKLNTLPQILRAMDAAGVRPWLQIEPHFSRQEWLALIEYLAAPYDPSIDTPEGKPWAYKRFRQGHANPWIDSFDRIYFELGNETWNRLFEPWVFPSMRDAKTGRRYSAGEVYGLYQEYVIGVMKSSPYWESSGLGGKIFFVLGGWNGQRYGRDAASISPHSDYLTIAAYNGGWDEGEGPPRQSAASLFGVLNQVSQSAIPGAERLQRVADDLNRSRKKPLLLGTYEAGPGYALNGLNGTKVTEAQAAEQEQVMKSLAAGTATLDSFLARAYRGFELQNFFTFGHGTYWKSHAPWYRGGQAYPSWKLLALFNSHALGDMLRTEMLSAPVADLEATKRRIAIDDAPLVAVYATRRGKRYSIVVISRRMPSRAAPFDDGYSKVSIDLPFKTACSFTLYKMTGDPYANNVNADNVVVQREELNPSAFEGALVVNEKTGADDRGLPPASTFLYVFQASVSTTQPESSAATACEASSG